MTSILPDVPRPWRGPWAEAIESGGAVADCAAKPAPAPHVPGNTESERFDNAVHKVFSVFKEELQKREAEWKQAHAKPPRARKQSS